MTADSFEQYEFHGLQPVMPVHDVASAVDFYTSKLGFGVNFVSGDPPDYARVKRGGIFLRFELVGQESKIAPTGYTYIHVGNGIDELCERYRANRVKIVMEPVSQPWRLREFEIEDLNGYRFRFAMGLGPG